MTKYQDPVDISVIKKREILDQCLSFFRGIPLFAQIEFNVIGGCNRRCAFCPVSNDNFYDNRVRGDKLDLSLYRKILKELNEVGYRGIVVYSGLSEPLLLKNIFEYVSLTKKILPTAQLQIVTNGDVLNADRLASLFECGLDKLLISLYDGPEQIEKFTTMCEVADIDKRKVVLRRRFFQDGNYGLTISNRSGLVNSDKFKDASESEETILPLSKPCHYPFYSLKINYDGDVTMCSHDWDSRLILGNLREESILDIWTAPTLMEIRRRLLNRDRRFAPCDKCDVNGTLMGSRHVESWGRLVNR